MLHLVPLGISFMALVVSILGLRNVLRTAREIDRIQRQREARSRRHAELIEAGFIDTKEPAILA